MIQAFQSFHDVDFLSHEWTKNFIVFILNYKNPREVKDFRPISLCNVSYCILAKILANRVRPSLDSFIISHEQTAFIPSWSVPDNILVVQEVAHSLFNSNGKNPYVILKLDLEKAYEKISRHAILRALQLIKFPIKFIRLIFLLLPLHVWWMGNHLTSLKGLGVLVKEIRFLLVFTSLYLKFFPFFIKAACDRRFIILFSF